MLIREIKNEDIEHVLKAIETFSEEHRELASEEIPKMLKIQGTKFFVCEVDGYAVGSLGYVPDQRGAKDIYWTEWGYVHKDFRKRGVATKLWDRVEAELRELGCRKIYIDIGNEEDHFTAIKLYKARGYKKEGELFDFWIPGENMNVYAKYL